MNTLYYGDNLQILRDYIKDESVDLIYLDPPFNSNRNYNVLFKDESGMEADSQIHAFEDTWHWKGAAETYHNLLLEADKVSEMLQAFYSFIGTNQMMAYLVMMAARLKELYRVLKPTGSLYLHCDPTASHYLKILLDTIFGASNFRNEIIWQRTGAHSDAQRWGRVSDTLLFYTKTDEYKWETQYVPYEAEYVAERYRYKDEKNGRLFWPNTMTAAGPGPARTFRGESRQPPPGTHWRFSQENIDAMEADGRIYYSSTGMPYVKSYLDEQQGRPIQNIWTDIRMTKSGGERLGYPTQKPVALLERIIQASSNEGDVVLDPFCGCGTTIIAAEKLKRKWIGIDITPLSVGLQKIRLYDSFKLVAVKDYRVVGQPTDLMGAKQLAKEDRYAFQWWALPFIGARSLGGDPNKPEGKKGSDKGIDGVKTFIDDKSGKAKRVLVQVKSGHVKSGDIRDLVGTIDREGAVIGVFLTLEEPSSHMINEAASAGFFHSEGWHKDYPRIQILTVEELLEGKQVNMPPSGITFKQAEALHQETTDQGGLFHGKTDEQ